MIPSASFEVRNGTGYDIFQYFSDFYKEDNLIAAGKIVINASSTYPIGEYDRETVDTLISTPGQGRWVSYDVPNSSITIDFLKNKFNLASYTLFTPKKARFINSWDIYGIFKNRMYLLDSRRNSDLCYPNPGNSSLCPNDDEKSFIVKNPGCFHKFRIVHVGRDSLSSFHFSLSGIKFYGSINPIFHCPTLFQKNSQLRTSFYLSFVVFCISH